MYRLDMYPMAQFRNKVKSQKAEHPDFYRWIMDMYIAMYVGYKLT